uniref:Uncharacterized protein n=1 Tax=Panagrolaimus sp. JU765 TaxID=591449 RepID=A0AC34PX06_9BILA
MFQPSSSSAFITFVCDILQQIQIEELLVETYCHITELLEPEQSDLFYHLLEAAKFVTKLQITCYRYIFPAFAELHNKLEYVEFLDYSGSIETFNSLPHYPSRIRLNFGVDYDSSVLENLTKKADDSLSFLFLDHCIPIEDLEQFLQTAKFKKGCEIYCVLQNSEGKRIHIFMTFISDEQGFEIETFPRRCSLIIANQKYDVEKKRILSLLVVESIYDYYYDCKYASWGVPFYVIMKTQPTERLFLDCIVDDTFECLYEEKNYVLQNVEENDWIKIIFNEDDAYVHYSHQMLESNFPRNDYLSAQERLEDINNILGSKITTIKAEMLSETIENLENGRICVSM